MGADMILRELYLPAGATIDLPAAKAAASRLSRHATVDDLRILLDRGWVDDDILLDPQTCTDDQLAARADVLRPVAERALHGLLDRFARSLSSREVARLRRAGHSDNCGVDAYITGGLSWETAPPRRSSTGTSSSTPTSSRPAGATGSVPPRDCCTPAAPAAP